MKTIFIIGLLCLGIVTGCKNTSINSANNRLNSYKTNTRKFNSELAKQLAADPGSFTYTFSNYFVKAGREYLNVSVNRENFQTVIAMLVNNWDKMQGIKNAKGLGYSGAKLQGLQLSVVTNSGHPEFIYQNINAIID
ncbi:hypothetical protein [Mucilaginibacter boryungensis]|uniref:Uncharacterized protein n=1 Tax=Mucilaginibacter boryungensis TaxID=768480 RepID=A0ABR9XEV7_9SPHI|nr:hypothetical protein [Mucilaginibacter boryungensis]MBE9665539.1 hypothetical protein [Mucilaginibacter boryungensis]